MTHQNQPRKKKKWRGQQHQQGQRRDQRPRPDQQLQAPASAFLQTRPAALPLADQPVRYDLIERGFPDDPRTHDRDQPFYLRPGNSRS